MTRLRMFVPLAILSLAGCDAQFDAQCDQYSALEAQLDCVDTAFMTLQTELPQDERVRERPDVDRSDADRPDIDRDGPWATPVAGDADRLDTDEGRERPDRERRTGDDLDDLRVRTRGACERTSESGERRGHIRRGIRAGRGLVDGRLGRDGDHVRDHDGDRDHDEDRDDENRP